MKKRWDKFAFSTALFLVIGFFWGYHEMNNSEKAGKLSEKKLKKLLASIPHWQGQSSLSAIDWKNIIDAAKLIQACDRPSVETSMHQCQLGGRPEEDFQQVSYPEYSADGKLFLLARVIFELPESVTNRDFILSGPWEIAFPSPPFINLDGSYNQSWPVKWNRGRPKLVVGSLTMEGIVRRYDAMLEYSRLSEKYPLRDLSTFQEVQADRKNNQVAHASPSLFTAFRILFWPF